MTETRENKMNEDIQMKNMDVIRRAMFNNLIRQLHILPFISHFLLNRGLNCL